MATFTLYVKYKGGKKDSAEKAITLLKTYLKAVVEKQKTFDGWDAVLVEDGNTPSPADTDVIVYMVRNVGKSVIKAQGGSAAIAEGNDGILGLTDLNLKICEVYADRLYEDSPRELSGAIYHETAHIKSNMDNAMHTGKSGFLGASPDYNGSPTDDNNEFVAKHLGRKVSMNAGY